MNDLTKLFEKITTTTKEVKGRLGGACTRFLCSTHREIFSSKLVSWLPVLILGAKQSCPKIIWYKSRMFACTKEKLNVG
jgi:hypothetical protein